MERSPEQASDQQNAEPLQDLEPATQADGAVTEQDADAVRGGVRAASGDPQQYIKYTMTDVIIT